MRYHLRFRHDGRLYLFDGIKFLQRDHRGDIAEIMADFTTLYCRVTAADTGEQMGAGRLVFRTFEDVAALANSLEFGGSFRVTGTDNPWKMVAAKNKFNAFTMRFVLGEYNPAGL